MSKDKPASLNDQILTAFRTAIRSEDDEKLNIALKQALNTGVLTPSRLSAVAQKIGRDQAHLLWSAASRAASTVSCIFTNPTTGAAELLKTHVSTIILIGPLNAIEAAVENCQKAIASAFYVSGVASAETPLGVWAAPYDLKTLSKISPQKIFASIQGITREDDLGGPFPLPQVSPQGGTEIVARSILVFRYQSDAEMETQDLNALEMFISQVFGSEISAQPVLFFEDAVREHLAAELMFLKRTESAKHLDAPIQIVEESANRKATNFVFTAGNAELGIVSIPAEIADKCDVDQILLDVNQEPQDEQAV